MPVNAHISVSFEAEDAAAVDAAVAAISFPEGAWVQATVSESVITGTVEKGGKVKKHDAPQATPQAELVQQVEDDV